MNQSGLITYRTRYKQYVELWFDMPEPASRFDVVIRHRAASPGKAGEVTDFFNLHIDLTRDGDELLRGFARNTRAQIRKSMEIDELNFEFIDQPTKAQLDEFKEFFDHFAASKGIPTLAWERVEAYANSGWFGLSRVLSEGCTLVWHANLAYGCRVSLMHSASHFREGDDVQRKMVGRANRRLHWEEMRRWQSLGMQVYDLGGWYEGNSDSQKLLINRFKEEFGGTKVHEYSVVENRSLRAKLMAAFKVHAPLSAVVLIGDMLDLFEKV